MDRILVRMNLREKLYQSMNIGKDKEWLVDLDYEGIPFRCNRCHRYGHISSSFTLPFNPKHNHSGSIRNKENWWKWGPQG